MRRGCYSFGEILDLVAHHLVWTGEAQAVETRLRGGSVTVRAFLRERYGVITGERARRPERLEAVPAVARRCPVADWEGPRRGAADVAVALYSGDARRGAGQGDVITRAE